MKAFSRQMLKASESNTFGFETKQKAAIKKRANQHKEYMSK